MTDKNQQLTILERNPAYSGLYLERSGVNAVQMVAELVSSPKRPLSDDAKSIVREFEETMLSVDLNLGTRFEGTKTVASFEPVTLEDALKLDMSEEAIAPLFFVEPILQGSVKIDNVDIPKFTSQDQVYEWLAGSTLNKSQYMDLSRQSTAAYGAHVIDALLSGSPIDEKMTETRSIVLEEEVFAIKMHKLQDARTMLLDWRQDAPGSKPEDIADAMRAYVDIFLSKINAKIASGIPIVNYLREQAGVVGDSVLEELASGLVSQRLWDAIGDDVSRRSLFKRLDFLRSGIGYDDSGKATGVTSALEYRSGEAPRGGTYSVGQMSAMQSIMLEPIEMQAIMKEIIGKAGLLSEEDESTWKPDRGRRANDNLFQVIINSSKDTFAVGALTGVYKVAAKPRSLYDLMIVGSFHELRHVDQAEADQLIGESVKIVAIQGKRTSGLREMGANIRQSEAEQKLFGLNRSYSPTYANALLMLEGGGTMGDAIVAFYDAKLQFNPAVTKLKAATEAADRVLRLVRGGINSQPLVYAEESVMERQLSGMSSQIKERAGAITGLDLVDQVRLHEFGLLPDIEGLSVDWGPIILETLSGRLNEMERSLL